jgi:putative tricarboxylic transport membrane protein
LIKSEAGLGGFAIALGIAVGIGATGFPQGSLYDALGPRLLPYIVAGGLVLTGFSILIGALRGRSLGETDASDIGPLVWIAAALVVPIVLIRAAGWIAVAALVFTLGARAFGSRRTLIDLALGLALGIATFALFNYALGLNLPAGSWIR